MSTTLTGVLWASTLFDAALLGLLVLRRPGPLTLASTLEAAWRTGIVAGAKALALLVATGGVSLFLLIHLAWLDLVVALPLVGAVLLVVARRRGAALTVRALGVGALLLVPVAAWASFVEPYRLVLETTRVPVESARAFEGPLRIAVLSDLQTAGVGDHERAAVRMALAQEPDLILLPGDLLQVDRDERAAHVEALRELLMPLDAPLGAWMVLGNVDDAAFVRHVLEGTPVRLLVNESVVLRHHGRPVRLAGVDLTARGPAARAVLASLEQDEGGELRLLLAHLPDVALTLPSPSRVDLMVCGHTHGGQVRLPLLGPPITLSGVPRRVAAGGLHDLGGRRLYLSRGIGWERSHAPRLRLLCPPEVSLLVLERGPPGPP